MTRCWRLFGRYQWRIFTVVSSPRCYTGFEREACFARKRWCICNTIFSTFNKRSRGLRWYQVVSVRGVDTRFDHENFRRAEAANHNLALVFLRQKLKYNSIRHWPIRCLVRASVSSSRQPWNTGWRFQQLESYGYMLFCRELSSVLRPSPHPAFIVLGPACE